MKNKTRILGVALTMIGFVSGCGLLGGNKIPNQQISDDLQAKTVKTTNGSSWNFSRDSLRCFAISESKYVGDSATLSMEMISEDYSAVGQGEAEVLAGSAEIIYKKESDGKWSFVSIEPKDLKAIKIDAKEVKTGGKMFEASKPVCGFFADNRAMKK